MNSTNVNNGIISSTIRIASRQSTLALWQANFVRQKLLSFYPQLEISLVPMVTSGDQIKGSLIQTIGKSLFVKELQTALLKGEADIAVHSVKDMSVYEHAELGLGAICTREDSRDVLISKSGLNLDQLPKGSIIGTSSPRRQSQLLSIRPDFVIKPLRGNVETRIEKGLSHEFDAIILAAAGLHRLGLNHHITQYLDPLTFIPAIGQGAIAIEYLRSNQTLFDLIKILNDPDTSQCVQAERAVNQRLGGDCMTPLGVYSFLEAESSQLNLYGMVGSLDGKIVLHAQLSANKADNINLGFGLADQLLAEGADSLLKANLPTG